MARQLYELVTARSLRKKSESVEQKRERINLADLQALEVAEKLSRVVLGPLASELRGKRLVVVADGALQYIPFAMLPIPNGDQRVPVADSSPPAGTNGGQPGIDNYQPLIVEHEIISLPSASTLAVQRRELAGRKMAPNSVALFADPVFDSTDARVKSKAKRTKGQTPDKVEDSAETRTLEHLTEQADYQFAPENHPGVLHTRDEVMDSRDMCSRALLDQLRGCDAEHAG